MTSGLDTDLRAIVGAAGLASPDDLRFHRDATESQGLAGRPDAVVLPADTGAIAGVVAWCYDHDVAIVPRGGGSGFSGGAVPVDGGVVVDLSRMAAVRQFDPLLWRIEVEAGLRTSELRRRARENGLYFPPDPGAAEQSQLGGNIATNAGGPHAFKYGVTGRWVTGLEAVIPPGEVISVGGPIRKDVAGYDLKSLLIGSEGTLGIVTAAWLRLIPAPEIALPVVGLYRDARAGVTALETILGSGIEPAAIEFLDAGAIATSAGAAPMPISAAAGFMLIAEADGREAEARRVAGELTEALSEGAIGVHACTATSEIAELWRWRDGVSLAVESVHGGKVSEDVVVPVDRLAEAVETTLEIGARHGLASCSWGHAGDGNLHSTFMVDPGNADELRRAQAAAEELYAFAANASGTISGEHGLGWVKRGHLGDQWNEPTLRLHQAVKLTLDPKNLMNPGKKT
jgi:glycolate oxidase subunit GlcD